MGEKRKRRNLNLTTFLLGLVFLLWGLKTCSWRFNLAAFLLALAPFPLSQLLWHVAQAVCGFHWEE